MYAAENKPAKPAPAGVYKTVSKQVAAKVHHSRVDARRRAEDIKYEKEEW